jgi:hypothetical protein
MKSLVIYAVVGLSALFVGHASAKEVRPTIAPTPAAKSNTEVEGERGEAREKEETEKKRDEASRGPDEKAVVKRATARSAVVEVRYIDGSTMKLTLLEECIEFNTPNGKLLIPVRDVQRIEVAFRIPDEVARRIEAAVADLGKEDFHRREAASAELLELRARAYPALQKAEKSSDAEVSRRAHGLLEKIREDVPAEQLEFRPDDVIYTAGSKNTGRITADKIKVHTFQFGDQQLKLADVRELRSPSPAAAAKPKVEVQWGGTWWPASILMTTRDKYLIHYEGWGAEWDEWVGQDRIRMPGKQ